MVAPGPARAWCKAHVGPGRGNIYLLDAYVGVRIHRRYGSQLNHSAHNKTAWFHTILNVCKVVLGGCRGA